MKTDSLDEGKKSHPRLSAIVSHATQSLVKDEHGGRVWENVEDSPLNGQELEMPAFQLVDGYVTSQHLWKGHVAIGHDGESGRVQENGKGAERHGD